MIDIFELPWTHAGYAPKRRAKWTPRADHPAPATDLLPCSLTSPLHPAGASCRLIHRHSLIAQTHTHTYTHTYTHWWTGVNRVQQPHWDSKVIENEEPLLGRARTFLLAFKDCHFVTTKILQCEQAVPSRQLRSKTWNRSSFSDSSVQILKNWKW